MPVQLLTGCSTKGVVHSSTTGRWARSAYSDPSVHALTASAAAIVGPTHLGLGLC